MRRIGTLSTAESTQRFGRFLAANGIENRIDEKNSHWEIWVYDEDRIDEARESLQEFEASPGDKRFDVKHLPPPPAPPREAPVRRPRRIRPVPSGQTPVMIALFAVSILITLATDFGNAQPQIVNVLMITQSETFQEILRGEVWRLFTPMFLHFHMLHLLFNMYMLWILGGIVERTKGSGAFALLVLSTAAVSHLAQFLLVGGAFGGMSGVIYGLFGYMWMKAVYSPEEGFLMPGFIVIQMMIWLLLGFSGMLGPIANFAHLGGLVAGMAFGAAPALLRGR